MVHKTSKHHATMLMTILLGAAAALPATGFADLDTSNSELRPFIERLALDRGNILRYYSVPDAPERRNRLREFYATSAASLAGYEFDKLGQDGKIDYILVRNEIAHELRRLDREEKELAENAAWVPFGNTIASLEESRRKMEPVDARKAAERLTELNKRITEARQAAETRLRTDNSPAAVRTRRIVGNRAATEANSLRNTLRFWFNFYDGYDPMFSWWAAEAYRATDASLGAYATFLRERVAGLSANGDSPAPAVAAAGGGAGRGGGGRGGQGGGGAFQASVASARAGSTDDIVGDPIGRDGLMSELAYEMIPYTPEQLIAIANKEYAWCESEMKKASREMGFGDDWKKAVEKIKTNINPIKRFAANNLLGNQIDIVIKRHHMIAIPPYTS